MATRHKEQHLVVGIALLLAGIACANPIPQRQAVASATVVPIIANVPTVATCDYVVTVDRLNMRTGPGTEYAGLLILRKGERAYDVTDMGNGWWRVSVFRIDETIGYVNAEYLEKECK